jgi:uncharacterized protein (DUF58 family)
MRFIRSLYLNNRFLYSASAISLLFFISYFASELFFPASIMLLVLVLLLIVDMLLLYSGKYAVISHRILADRFSNGDVNEVKLIVTNSYPYEVKIRIIDELPVEFQIRDFEILSYLESNQTKYYSYNIRPVKRGEYTFGSMNIYVKARIGLISRRFKFDSVKTVAVYPSITQMKKYGLMAISNRLKDVGVKKIRRIGHALEFDQIKEYVLGDDHTTINWKATARRNQLMVNHYMDEKAQQVYSVIDMGRNMKMPFGGMALLDYAINTSLVISNISILKQDKAGIVTFNNKITSLLPAERNSSQMKKILELLYNQQTAFLESDYEKMAAVIKAKIKQRSLILLYTNFESLSSLRRQINYFRALSASHLVIVIFFLNTGLNSILSRETESIESVYHKVIAEKLAYEKRQIVKELARYGIQSILSEPDNLSVNTINKYLELKARGMI